jgi:Ca2+-dependent lipid-binding protein
VIWIDNYVVEMHGCGAGKSSPYCVLTCGAQRSKTPIAQDAGSNPYWNSTFMFKIDRSCQEIGIKIYCHNTLAADDELAYTRYAVYDKRFAQLSLHRAKFL